MKIHHVAIQVADLGKSRAFYCDLLGLTEIRRQPHSIWLDAEGTIVMLELASPPSSAGVARGELQALAFAMEPSERVSWEKKLHVESGTDYTIYTRDPDGTRVALSSYPVKSR